MGSKVLCENCKNIFTLITFARECSTHTCPFCFMTGTYKSIVTMEGMSAMFDVGYEGVLKKCE